MTKEIEKNAIDNKQYKDFKDEEIGDFMDNLVTEELPQPTTRYPPKKIYFHVMFPIEVPNNATKEFIKEKMISTIYCLKLRDMIDESELEQLKA